MKRPLANFVILQCALGLGAIAVAQSRHATYLETDETAWARKLGLKPSYVRQIIQAAGYSQDDAVRIDELDVRDLQRGKHLLLVTSAGNGHCLTLTVLARNQSSLEKIWDLSELPENAGGLCYVIKNTKNLLYRWNGQSYELNKVSARSRGGQRVCQSR